MKIARFLKIEDFLKSINHDQGFYVPNVRNFWGSDPNEGRFTNEYVQKVREVLIKRQKKNDAQMFIDSNSSLKYSFEIDEFDLNIDLQIKTLRMLKAIEHSFVSCWTTDILGEQKNWDVFGGCGNGVQLCSSSHKVSKFLHSATQNITLTEDLSRESRSDYDVREKLIIYDKENMHTYDFDVDDAFEPFFFIKKSNSFQNEKEYRFLLIDFSNYNEEIRDELINECVVKGNVVDCSDEIYSRLKNLNFGYKTLRSDNDTNNIWFEDLVEKVVIGDKVSFDDENNIRQFIVENQLNIEILKKI